MDQGILRPHALVQAVLGRVNRNRSVSLRGWTGRSGLLCWQRRTEARVANKKPAIWIAVVIAAALWLLAQRQTGPRAGSGTDGAKVYILSA